MKTKFDTLMEKYETMLMEQDPTIGGPEASAGAPDAGAAPPPDVSPAGQAGAPAAPPPADKSVSQGYAYTVNLLYNLFKQNSEDLDEKYYGLSDNEISDPQGAKRYLEVMSKLLPQTTLSGVKSANFGKNKEGEEFIDMDDSKMVEMAQIAQKALFYSPKNNLEFSSKLDDIENILARTGNKVTVENANAVYTEIKNFVGMENEMQ